MTIGLLGFTENQLRRSPRPLSRGSNTMVYTARPSRSSVPSPALTSPSEVSGARPFLHVAI